MRKDRSTLMIAITVILVMTTLTLLPTQSGLLTANSALSSTGTITQTPKSTINKGVFAYGASFSDSDASFIANHFSIIDVDFGTQGVASIKAKNSNVKVIGYKDLIGMQTSYADWAIVNTHEDWFIHDASGNRVRNPVWGWYLMDPGNQGWRSHWITNLNSKLGTLYDGVFVDDVYNTIEGHGMSVPSSVVARWHNDNLAMLQYVKANISPGKLVIINTDEWNSYTYVSVVDGEVLEGFTHCDWEAINTQGSRDTGLIMAMIKNMATNTAAGKIVWGISGTIVSSNTEEMNRMVKYCYASFLLGASGTGAIWEFNNWDSADGSKGYYPIMDTQIGSPKAAYYQTQNVYARDYTGGKVLFNPSGNTYTISLGGTYHTISGTTVTTLTIGAFSSEIVLS